MRRTARTRSVPVNIAHEGERFHETITIQAESGTVHLTWTQGREITRWMELIAQAGRNHDNIAKTRHINRAREELGALKLTLDEGRAVRTYYLAKFYDPKIPMRCHW